MAANKNSNAATATSAKKDAEDIHVATSYDFSPDGTVTLVVGSEQKRMLVHSTYLTCDSDFFKAALKKEWVEGQSHVIKLPEEDPETMAHYMTFVYSDKLPFDGIDRRSVHTLKRAGRSSSTFTCVASTFSIWFVRMQ